MAASEENSALFPIFILTIMAIPIVPYTITKLCRAATKKSKSIHCHCSECTRSGKYRKSIFKRVRSFSLTLIFLLRKAFFFFLVFERVSHGAVVRLPPCGLEVTSSNPRNNLSACRVRLHIFTHPRPH